MLKHLLSLILCLIALNTEAQRLVKEFTPGSFGSYFYFMGNTQKGFVMNVYNPTFGVEPWISDGTNKGTFLLKDIGPGASNSLFSNDAFSNDTILYFFAFNESNSNVINLWRTDGSINGTYFIDSLGPNYPNKYYEEATFYKGEFYYFISSQSYKTLYATDGSQKKPRKIYSFKDSNYISRSSMKVFNNQLYFYGYDKEHGAELWTSDGTSAGTKLMFDLNTGNNSSIFNNGKLVSCQDKLFFVAQRYSLEGFELFYIDKQSSEPWLLRDFTPLSNKSSQITLIEGNDSFFLFNVLNASPAETYVSDGNWSNTRKFHTPKEPDPNPYHYTYGVHQTKNFTLVSSYTSATGVELFKSDQQFNNLGLLRDINPGIGNGNNGNNTKIFEVGNKAYFLGFNFMLGNDIWVTDGTSDSTILYLEFAGNNQTMSDILHQWNNRLFFAETVDINLGTELYELNINRSSSIDQQNLYNSGVYPNPVKAGTFLNVSDTESHIALFNVHGQKVWETTSSNGMVQIPEFISKGIYSISIRTTESETHHKIVIE
jgi:ELWxxDGT repeat protein